MMDYTKWISAAVGSLLLWGTIILLRKWFPARESKTIRPEETLSEKEYQKLQILFLLLFAVCFFLIGALLLQINDWWLAHQHATLSEGSELILPDPWGAYFALGLFALASGGLFTHFLVQAFLGERAQLFAAESARRSRMDVLKIFRWLYGGILLLAIALIILLAETYVRVEPDRIVFNDFFGWKEQVYPIVDIQDIAYAQFYLNRQGKLIIRPHYRIDFADGTSWATKQFPYGIEDPTPYAPLFERLAQKRGLNIQSD